MKKADGKLQVMYSMAQGSYWLMAVIVGAFLTPLLAARGFSEAEIGIISAVRSISSCVFQLVLAYLSDKYAKKIQLKYIVIVLAWIGEFVSLYFYKNAVGFYEAILIFVLFGLSITSLAPLLDSMSALYMNAGKQLKYHPARAFGSFTWAIACLALGSFCERYGENKMILLQMIFMLLFIGITFFMEKVSEKEEKREENRQEPHNIIQLFFLSRGYTLMVIGLFAASMCYNMGNCFLVDIIQNRGGTTTHYGVANFVLAVSEVFTVFLFTRFREKWGLKVLMVIFVTFNTSKVLCMLLFSSVYSIIGIQVLQMFGYGIFYPACVAFVMEELPEEDVVKGVSVSNVVNCIGAAVGFYVSGQIYARWDINTLLWSSAILGGISICIMCINAILDKKGKNVNVAKLFIG